MRRNHPPLPVPPSEPSLKLLRNLLCRGTGRQIVCLVVAFNLLLLPMPNSATQQAPASASSQNIIKKRVTAKAQGAQQETLADRLGRVARIEITPAKFVGYQGQSVTLTALGRDSSGRTIQGTKVNWTSSDPAKLIIDDSGRADLLSPGLVSLICQAGQIRAEAHVLIRPGERPVQSDLEWELDQASLAASPRVGGFLDITGDMSVESFKPAVVPQGGGGNDFGYDQLWSEPRNLVGSPRNRCMDGWRLGTILPESSNFTTAIPLYGLGGRGLAASLTLYYNSRVWTRRNDGGVEKVAWNAAAGWPFAGYSLGFGRIMTYGPTNATKYVWIEPDGTRRYLGSGSASTTGTYQTTDGSHLTYVGSATNGGNLYFNDGTKVTITVTNNRLLPSQIRDLNGNYITIAYKWSSGCQTYPPMALYVVTDTLGRSIEFNYTNSPGSCNMELTSITVPGYGGTSQNPVSVNIVSFDYQNLTVSYNYSGLTVENAPTGTQRALRHVYFKEKNRGYLMTYSQYGMVYNVSLRKEMEIDQNGAISDGVEVASANFNYPTSSSTQLTDAPAFTQRGENPGGTFTFSSSMDAIQQTKTFKTTRPDSSELWLVRSTDATSQANGLLTESLVKNNSSATLAKTVFSYTTDGSGSKQVQSVISYDDAGAPTRVDFDYDSYGNVTNKRDYGFQIGGQWKVRRRTRFVYKTDAAYTNIYLRSLVTETDVYDAIENTSDADDVMISKVAFTHDDYSGANTLENYGGTANPPGHLSSFDANYTTRGNVTHEKRYKDVAGNQFVTSTTRYDIFGNAVKLQPSCCNEKTETLTESTYWSEASSETTGSDPNHRLMVSMTYDFNTSVEKSETEPGDLTTNYSYDSIARLTQVSPPEGSTMTTTYDEVNLKQTVTTTYYEGTSPITVTNSTTFDGWGQTIKAINQHNGQVNITYDAMGRVTNQTNPFQSGGTPGPSMSYAYDALGRPTTTTLQDGNTIQTTYNGAAVTVTDQVNRKIKRETGGLGRLVKVTEQDSSGNLTQETTYTYNLLDKLTAVNQGNQTRAFKYDDLGRMLYERIPEQSATINDGTGVMWSCQYTYNDSDLIATRKDARGVITSYTYDTLNRLTGVSYNVSGTSVVATDSVQYIYNNMPSSDTHGQLLKVELSSGGTGTFREEYGYDSYNRLSSRVRSVVGSYTTSYQYNEGNQLTEITYPSGRVVGISHDATGRLSVAVHTNGNPGNVNNDYMTGAAYNYAGQLTDWTLGANLQEGFGYNGRMQIVTQTAGTVSPYTNLMNLTYSYQASAGQNGASTTAGNSGQLMSVSGTINGTTESAAYTYDLQQRLATSNQTTNGASGQRRFEYDRWGNRTSVWDAVSGGTQIQSVTLQQSGGVPTNRIQTVTGGGTFNYTYDACGNVTSDGVHSYTYDAENRLVKVDNGTTATYTYDHQNRRIKSVVGATSTHYVWEGFQVLAEHNASNGTVKVDYIYAAGRMIAKEEAGAGETRFLLSDRLSVREVVGYNRGSGAYVVRARQGHLPFGEELGASGTTDKHKFTSYERDAETGTDYAVNRQYAQSVGRFMRVDPHKGSCDYNNPQSYNRYSYVENDPANKMDPLGLMTSMEFLCILNPILCEDNRLPGGGPRPNPDSWGLFGVRVTFRACRCEGTTDCSYYDRACKQVSAPWKELYYCTVAPPICKNTGDTCFTNCVRLCLQVNDNCLNWVAGPEAFAACQITLHGRCAFECGLDCFF